MTQVLAPEGCDDGFPAPRPFQANAHESLRQGFRNGHKNQIIMAPTGAGKTYLGLRICNEAMQRGRRAVFLCDRTTLRINQTSKKVADANGLTSHAVHSGRTPAAQARSLAFRSPQCRRLPSGNFGQKIDVLSN
jgi:superfamily II DNA or RNA helicase